MPIKLIAPIVEDFVLEKTDAVFGDEAEEPTTISVRQATQGEHERRQGLYDKMYREVVEEDGKTRVIASTRFNFAELQRMEVFLTLADCNIIDEAGKPLFLFKNNRVKMNSEAFKEAWNKLPMIVANEIHEKVLKVNVSWAYGVGEED